MNRAVAALSLVTMALAPIAGLTQQKSSAEDEWAAIVQCAAIKNVDARHQCTDAVMRGAGLLGDAATERRAQFGLSKSAPAAAAAPPAEPAAAAPNPAPAAATAGAAGAQAPATTASAAAKAAPDAPATKSAAPAPASAKASSSGTAGDGSEARRVDVTLAHVEVAKDGTLTLTTSEGAVWRELENDAINPRPREGDAMIIERTKFGGYFCRMGKHVTFRCVRKS
jgi:hypothetical protein